jgi:HlyD family secretion protein/macrolide-specific efflux system membrane fusion protein
MRISGKLRGFLIIVVGIGFLALLVRDGTFQGLFLGKKDHELTLGDYEFKPATRKDIFQKVLATGTVTLKTGAEVKIGARISGQLNKLMVKIGDFVRAGDTIATIEHEDLLARVARVRADLKTEKARLEKIRNERPLEINKSRATLEELNAKLGLAEKMFVRNQALKEEGVVSDKAVDEAEERVMVLGAQIKLAEEELKLDESRLESDVRLQEAVVEKARATLREERTRLSYATITATIDGIVAFVSTQEGETVVAGLSAPTFVTLTDLSKLEMTAFVDETDIGKVKVRQKVKFTVDAYPEKFFSARVREIHPKAIIKDNVVNYEVMLEIDRKNIFLLRPEMTANIVVTTGVHKNALTIPRGAVKRSGKKSFAVVKSNGGADEKVIELGWRDGNDQEVVSGLSENEEVGVLIKPKEEKSSRRRRR